MKTANIFDIPHLRPLGRFHEDSARAAGTLPLLWACSGWEVRFTGSALEVLLEADDQGKEPWIAVDVNGAPLIRTPAVRGQSVLPLFQGMTPGAVKHVRFWKDTQPMGQDGDPAHRLWVRGLRWEGGEFLPLPEPACRLEFIGDSLTSAEGAAGAREETDWTGAIFSASRGWAWQTADLLGGECRIVSQSGWGLRSGWDNNPHHALPEFYGQVCGTAPGGRALGALEPYDFASWRPDAVLVNLGTNDAGAMNNPPWWDMAGRRFQQTWQELDLLGEAAVSFLKLLHEKNPGAALVWAYGMLGDPLRACLEGAVARFRREAGAAAAWYLPLPAVSEATMGARMHPGPLCHRQAAETAADFLRNRLPAKFPCVR